MSETTKSPKLKNSSRILEKRKKNSKHERDYGVAMKLKISEEFSESDREWAGLPQDVSFFIQDKLFEVVDRVCFAATCKEWLSLSKDYDKAMQHLCKDAMGKVLPLLLSPDDEHLPKEYEGNLIAHSVSEEKRYNKLKWSLNEYGNRSVRCRRTVHWHHDNPPRVWPGVWGLENRRFDGFDWSLENKWCGGSSQGWLVVVDLVDDVCFNITLVHPFNKSMAPICLPPLDFMTKPHLGRKRDVPELVTFTQNYPEYLQKVILSGPPSSNPQHCFDVIAICDNGRQLAFLKLGGQEEEIKEWVYVEVDHMTDLQDVVFYRNKVYAVELSGKIISIDVSRCKLPKGKILAPGFEKIKFDIVNVSRFPTAYLVKSSEGDHLWHVRRVVVYANILSSHEAKEGFEVYKVKLDDKDGSIVERVEVKSIENEALFVGGFSHSVSVLASNFPGCKPNSIYYRADSGVFYYEEHDKGKPYQIFSLEDQTVKQMKSSDYKKNTVSRGVWVLPTLH